MLNTITTIMLIALSLALDAVTVSIAGGLAARRVRWRDALKVGLYFGVFQAVMPILGWLLGGTFRTQVASVSGWIALVLLSALGGKMIWEAFTPDVNKPAQGITGTKTLLLLAFATSIDALVVGVTLNLVSLPLVYSAVIIGIVTFVLSLAGYRLGKRIGSLVSGKIEAIGGLCLIAVGVKLFLN